jgi:hypothetical protein
MSGVKKWHFFIIIFAVISLLSLSLYAGSEQGHKSKGSPSAVKNAEVYTPMPGPGKKIPLSQGHYFIYGFDKKPQMGTVIIKVEVYKGGKKDTSLEIKGDAGMPSMRGAHDTGDRPFKISKNGAYLLPIDIVMPGDWEIRLTFTKSGQVIFRGSYKFDV